MTKHLDIFSHLIFLVCVLGCSPGEQPKPENIDSKAPEAAPASDEPAEAKPSNEENLSLAIFKKRILPIFRAAKPSSCAECHLSGVDLKQYIRPTQAETFASLVSAGLIDVKQPAESKLLKFIEREPDKPSLVSAQVRQEEFAAFQAWIQAAVADPALLSLKSDTAIGPELPTEVIRHARHDRVLASFIENIWHEVGRCAACHSPDRNQKQVQEHGEQVSWITLNDPAATLDYMLEGELIDAEQPDQSLILLKPTLQVKHGGGQKMVVGDRSYKQFRRFIEDYSATVHGKYVQAEQLPAESKEISITTDIWLKIEGIPAKFDKQLLQIDLFQQTDNGWSIHRVATSDRPVFGAKNLWQHSLSLIAQRGSPWATELQKQQLPRGRYLAKIYVDQTEKLQSDYTSQLDQTDLVGEVEFDSTWPVGYGRMTVVKFPEE